MLSSIVTVLLLVASLVLLPTPVDATAGGYVDVNGFRYQLANSAVDVDGFDFAGDDCAAFPCTFFPVPATCTATFTASSADITTVATSKSWGAPFLASSSGIYSAVSWLPNPPAVVILDLSSPGYVALSDYGYQARILLRCQIPCPPGAILVGNSCSNCSVGKYPSNGACVACTNALANAYYTSFGTSNNCLWACSSGRYLRGMYAPTLLIGDISTPSAVRQVSPAGYVSTVYQPSSASDPTYNFKFMAISNDKMHLFLGTTSINRVNISSGAYTQLVGSAVIGSSDGIGTAATFNAISSVFAFNNDTSLLVSDSSNCNLRLVTTSSLTVTTLAGLAGNCGFRDAVGTASQFRAITDAVYDETSGTVYVADSTNYRVRMVLSNQTVITIAGNGAIANADGVGTMATITPVYLALGGGTALYVKTAYTIRRIDLITFAVTTPMSTPSSGPMQMALGGGGLFMYFANYYSVSSLFFPTAYITFIAGSYGVSDGLGVNGRFRNPQFVAVVNETVVPNAICMACTSCSVGFYGQCTANTSDCVQCQPDQFSNAGATTCSYCPAGKYASNGACQNCAVGTFSSTGATECGSCAAGTYLPTPTGTCVNCSAGTYSLYGSTTCGRCANLPSNATYSGLGGNNVTNCSYVCNSGFSYIEGSGGCSRCEAGNWSAVGSTSCYQCLNLPPNATYSGVGSNATNCPIACDIGFYQSPRNASLCLPCAAGTRMVGGKCVPCPAGGYSDAGASTCTPCLNGNYALANSTACTSCPNQTPFTTFIGRGTSSACTFICRAGSYVFNRTTCATCSAGTYTPTPGFTACRSCTGGTWSEPGSSVCTACSSLDITATYNDTMACTDYPLVCHAGWVVATIVCVP